MISITSRKMLRDRSECSTRNKSNLSRSPVKTLSPLGNKGNSSTLKAISTKNETFSNLTIDMNSPLYRISQELFQAKCKDLGITPVPEQERRFISSILNSAVKRKLVLQDQKLILESSIVISRMLFKSTMFAYIDLSKNKLGDIGTKKIIKSLMGNTDLVSLDISSNDLTQAGCSEILELLGKHPSLYSLDISSHQFVYRNKIGANEGLIHILKCSTLNYLNLSGTGIGNEGLKQLILGLENNKGLYSLNISNNGIKGGIIKDLVQVLVTSTISEIFLDDNQIEEVAAEEISYFFNCYYGYGVISKMSLAGNIIPSSAAYKIFESLIKENCLEHLNLENHNFNGFLDVLERFLLCNKRLKSLNLSNCKLKVESFCRICEGLASNKSLETLILSENSCKDTGALAMAKALSSNSSLKKLDISSNVIKTNGGLALASSLRINKTLKSLDLSDNEIKDEVGEAFYHLFGSNYTLTKLQLAMNPMSAKYYLDIQKYLERNKGTEQKAAMFSILENKEKLRAKMRSAEKVNQQILEQQIEKKMIENKIGGYAKRLLMLKNERSYKVEELKNELKELKVKNVVLSKELLDIQTEIRNKNFSEEKVFKEYEQKNREIDLSINNLLMKKMSLSQTVDERKKHFKHIYQGFALQLAMASKEKASALALIKSIKAKSLEKTTAQVPRQVIRIMSKTPPKLPGKYLSSEKLRTITKSKSPNSREVTNRMNFA